MFSLLGARRRGRGGATIIIEHRTIVTIFQEPSTTGSPYTAYISLMSRTSALILALLLLTSLAASPPTPPHLLLSTLPSLEFAASNLSAAAPTSPAALAALPAALEALADAQSLLRRHGAAASSRAAALRAMLRASGGTAEVGTLILSYAQQAKDLQGARRYAEALAMLERARAAGARGGGLPAAAAAALLEAESELRDCQGNASGALRALERAAALHGGGRAGADAALARIDLLRKAAAEAAAAGTPAAEALRARETREVAALLAMGPWEHPQQLPRTYLRGLFSAPWHVHSGAGARWRTITEPAAKALEGGAAALAAEFAALKAAGKLLDESECVHVGGGGEWKWYATNGFWVELDAAGCAVDTPAACALLAALAADLPQLRVVRAGYSAISGRAHLRPHCGWTNAQLKMHVGLVVPKERGRKKGGAACAHLRVGNETRAWEKGKVLFFDDSYEHEVTHKCEAERVVFQLVFEHPDSQQGWARAPQGGLQV